MPTFGLPEGDPESKEGDQRVVGLRETMAEVVAEAFRKAGLREVEIVPVSPKLAHVCWRDDSGYRRCVQTRDMAALILANREARNIGGRAKL
jgi:hypothetical protein